MNKRRVITLLIGALWLVFSTPYFATTLLLSHGQHKISSTFDEGYMSLTFQHDHEDGSHHHSKSKHQDPSKNQSPRNGAGDHILTVQDWVGTRATAHTITFGSATVLVDSWLVKNLTLMRPTTPSLTDTQTERIPRSLRSLRTVILLL